MRQPEPRLVVFTTLFPHAGQPVAGLFVRERMFRVAKVLPLTVVAPVPWFPLQGLLRRWKPGFRPAAPRSEVQDGIEVRYPRFFSVPGAFKWLDGFFMALGCLPTMRRLKRSFAFNVIDAHFAYPDGYAATLLGPLAARPGHDHAARDRGAAVARPAASAADDRGAGSCQAGLLGIRFTQAARREPWRARRQDRGRRQRHRHREVPSCRAARGPRPARRCPRTRRS